MAKTKGEAVLDRLVALEAQSRRLRRLSLGLAVATALVVVIAVAALIAPYNAGVGYYLGRALGRPEVVEATKKIIEAEQYVLRAPDGKVRATIGLRGENAMGVDLYDRDGKARAGLDLGADGQPSLWLAGSDGEITASFNGQGMRLSEPAGSAAFLTASGLTLLDGAQKARVGLSLKEGISPSLALYDKDGKTGALVDISSDGSRLGLFYGGIVRAGIGYGPGGSQLNLFSEDGRDHATLSLMPDGSTGLLFHDQQGKQRIALGVLANDVSGLSLFDQGQKQRAGISVSADGAPRLELFDGGGSRRAGLTLSGDGLPALQLEDRGQPRAVLGAGSFDGKRAGLAGRAPSVSSLLLFDRDGSVVFQAPVY